MDFVLNCFIIVGVKLSADEVYQGGFKHNTNC